MAGYLVPPPTRVRSSACVSGEPEAMRAAAALRRESLERLQHRISELESTGARAAATCGVHVVDRGIPQRLREVVNAAWDIDHGVDATAGALADADRRHRLDDIASRTHRHLPPDIAALVARHRGMVLRFDGCGDGRLVTVLGDIAGADHIAILVPGMGSDLGNVGSLVERAAAIEREMARRARRGERVAVIAWLGYNAPDGSPFGVVDVARRSAARRGAFWLLRDVDLVRTIAPAGVHLTVIGHSYGSLLVGEAMRVPAVGLDVEDVIVAGSPGMGVQHRGQLGQRSTRVWATSLWRDPVRVAPAHGADPARPWFGARRLPAAGVSGHGGYFDDGTGSLTAIALVAVGRRERKKSDSGNRRPEQTFLKQSVHMSVTPSTRHG